MLRAGISEWPMSKAASTPIPMASRPATLKTISIWCQAWRIAASASGCAATVPARGWRWVSGCSIRTKSPKVQP